MKYRKFIYLLKKGAVCAAKIFIILLLATGALILFRSMANKIFLVNYRNGTYSQIPEKALLPLKFGENYVVPYNLGNVEFQKGNYEQAVGYYVTALHSDPPSEEKECKIRINLALAILHNYPFDTMDMENSKEIEEALDVLYTARSVLTENGCADESFDSADGHCEEAEKLKKDIDEMIRKLEAALPHGGGGGNDNDQEGGGEEKDDQSHPESPEKEKQRKDPRSSNQNEEEKKQKSLQEQLKEQKQDLEEGTYSGGGNNGYIYLDLDGQVLGYGEGVPW